jgi:hypothetical protein
MGLHDTYDYVLAPAVASNALTEHAVCFANARSVAEKKLEDALLLLGGNLFQPLFWTFLHENIVI